MTHHNFNAAGIWHIPFCMLLLGTMLIGCEKDNETQSVVAPAQTQQTVQSSGMSLKPLRTQVGSPEAMRPTELIQNSYNSQEFSNLADSYFESQRYIEAIALYEKAISLNSSDVDSMNDLGLAYFYVGQPDKALAALANATSTSPVYKHAWLSTGYILFSLQRYDEAVEPLQKARNLDPDGIVGTEAAQFLDKIRQIKVN